MPRHDYSGSGEWERTVGKIDKRLNDALSQYVKKLELYTDEWTRACNALAALRAPQSRDPDYSVKGIAAAYAFRYMPHRVSSLMGTFAVAPYLRKAPRRVLDLGSGSDATSMALSLAYPGDEIEVMAVDTSVDMRCFGECLRLGTVSRSYEQLSLDDVVSGKIPAVFGWFDLVVMSACFGYVHQNRSETFWDGLAAALYELTDSPSTVMVIEPKAKRDCLLALNRSLDQRGFRCSRLSSEFYPKAIRSSSVLTRLDATLDEYHAQLKDNELTKKGRDFIGPPWPVESWNPRMRDDVLLAWQGADVVT